MLSQDKNFMREFLIFTQKNMLGKRPKGMKSPQKIKAALKIFSMTLILTVTPK
jgi:hypothetical protein